MVFCMIMLGHKQCTKSRPTSTFWLGNFWTPHLFSEIGTSVFFLISQLKKSLVDAGSMMRRPKTPDFFEAGMHSVVKHYCTVLPNIVVWSWHYYTILTSLHGLVKHHWTVLSNVIAQSCQTLLHGLFKCYCKCLDHFGTYVEK